MKGTAKGKNRKNRQNKRLKENTKKLTGMKFAVATLTLSNQTPLYILMCALKYFVIVADDRISVFCLLSDPVLYFKRFIKLF